MAMQMAMEMGSTAPAKRHCDPEQIQLDGAASQAIRLELVVEHMYILHVYYTCTTSNPKTRMISSCSWALIALHTRQSQRIARPRDATADF